VKNKLYILLIVTLSFQFLNAQLTEGGVPLSFIHSEIGNDSEVMTINLTPPNVTNLLIQDGSQSRSDGLWRDGVAVSVDAGIESNMVGSTYDLNGIGKVWKLRLRAQGALSMEINFDEFELPAGSSLYIYSPNQTDFIGGYSSENNKAFSKLSTELIDGDQCVIEYFEPNSNGFNALLHIKDITYRYRDFLNLEGNGGSQPCEVDVNCEEGVNWQEVKNSVVRTRVRIGNDFFWSTGTLINNTAMDCKPYILSSLRSNIHPTLFNQSDEEDYQYYRFYFDYERSECGAGGGVSKSISGASLRATSNDEGGVLGSDFVLLELSEDIPMSYNPHWAGWNVQTVPDVPSGVSIHHPMADVKKISTFNVFPENAGFGISNTHWRIFWSGTSNGFGVTEIGSIGAPIFDEEGRVFGTLTTGASNCNEILPGGVNNPDLFGKMSKHWVENPNPIQQKLRFWLDPSGLGVAVFAGSNHPCAVGIDELNKIEFVLSPNPTRDQFRIICKSEDIHGAMMVIYDALGRKVIEQELNNTNDHVIDGSKFPVGTYVVSLVSENGIFANEQLIIHR